MKGGKKMKDVDNLSRIKESEIKDLSVLLDNNERDKWMKAWLAIADQLFPKEDCKYYGSIIDQFMTPLMEADIPWKKSPFEQLMKFLCKTDEIKIYRLVRKDLYYIVYIVRFPAKYESSPQYCVLGRRKEYNLTAKDVVQILLDCWYSSVRFSPLDSSINRDKAKEAKDLLLKQLQLEILARERLVSMKR
ncbi:MAG: hypothetical protein QME57_00225 [Patescibacteria group bacterium]|nr:hypothetical protein [Patescibacteria group bacterium]